MTLSVIGTERARNTIHPWRILWVKIQSDGLLDTALDLKCAMDLNNRVILFFDRAIFYVTQGYELENEASQVIPISSIRPAIAV